MAKKRPSGYFALQYAWEHQLCNTILLIRAIEDIERKLNLYEMANAHGDIAPTVEAIRRAVELAVNINKEL